MAGPVGAASTFWVFHHGLGGHTGSFTWTVPLPQRQGKLPSRRNRILPLSLEYFPCPAPRAASPIPPLGSGWLPHRLESLLARRRRFGTQGAGCSLSGPRRQPSLLHPRSRNSLQRHSASATMRLVAVRNPSEAPRTRELKRDPTNQCRAATPAGGPHLCPPAPIARALNLSTPRAGSRRTAQCRPGIGRRSASGQSRFQHIASKFQERIVPQMPHARSVPRAAHTPVSGAPLATGVKGVGAWSRALGVTVSKCANHLPGREPTALEWPPTKRPAGGQSLAPATRRLPA